MIDASLSFDLAIHEEDDQDPDLILIAMADYLLVAKQPTTSEISAYLLRMQGKSRESGAMPAVRNFLDQVVLTKEDIAERVKDAKGEIDLELKSYSDDDKIADVDTITDWLEDRRIRFGSDELVKVISAILEKATGFPTKRSSGSTTSSSSTGTATPATSPPPARRRSSSPPPLLRADLLVLHPKRGF